MLFRSLVLWSTRDIANAIRTQRVDYLSIDPQRQLLEMLSNPTDALGVFVRTVAYYGESWVQGIVGLLGYNTVPVVQPFGLICLGTILIAALHSERLPKVFAWACLIGGLLTAAAVIAALYLTFNSVGAPVSDGVQGRYFIPALFFILISLPTLLPVRVRLSLSSAPRLFVVGAAVPVAGGVILWAATLY